MTKPEVCKVQVCHRSCQFELPSRAIDLLQHYTGHEHTDVVSGIGVVSMSTSQQVTSDKPRSNNLCDGCWFCTMLNCAPGFTVGRWAKILCKEKENSVKSITINIEKNCNKNNKLTCFQMVTIFLIIITKLVTDWASLMFRYSITTDHRLAWLFIDH
jgi:hypothetical protein